MTSCRHGLPRRFAPRSDGSEVIGLSKKTPHYQAAGNWAVIARPQAIGPSRGRRQLGHREAAGNWAVIARPQAVAIHVLMRSKRLCKVWLLVRYLQHQFAKVLAIK